jgi:hypothetical protein
MIQYHKKLNGRFWVTFLTFLPARHRYFSRSPISPEISAVLHNDTDVSRDRRFRSLESTFLFEIDLPRRNRPLGAWGAILVKQDGGRSVFANQAGIVRVARPARFRLSGLLSRSGQSTHFGQSAAPYTGLSFKGDRSLRESQ